eukprot:COSAG01_NODE_21894_length_880_cov_3.420838_1_plen_227_part_10
MLVKRNFACDLCWRLLVTSGCVTPCRNAREAELTLDALVKTRKQAILRQFMEQLDGLRLLDRLLRKFTVEKDGGTSCTLSVFRAIEALPVSVGAVSSCDIVSTLTEVASVADRVMSGDGQANGGGATPEMLSRVKDGALRSRTELDQKVKSFALLRSTTIQKKRHSGGASSDGLGGDGSSSDVGREVDRTVERSICVEGIPNAWGRRDILGQLSGLGQIVAVEMAGV